MESTLVRHLCQLLNWTSGGRYWNFWYPRILLVLPFLEPVTIGSLVGLDLWNWKNCITMCLSTQSVSNISHGDSVLDLNISLSKTQGWWVIRPWLRTGAPGPKVGPSQHWLELLVPTCIQFNGYLIQIFKTPFFKVVTFEVNNWSCHFCYWFTIRVYLRAWELCYV